MVSLGFMIVSDCKQEVGRPGTEGGREEVRDERSEMRNMLMPTLKLTLALKTA